MGAYQSAPFIYAIEVMVACSICEHTETVVSAVVGRYCAAPRPAIPRDWHQIDYWLICDRHKGNQVTIETVSGKIRVKMEGDIA